MMSFMMFRLNNHYSGNQIAEYNIGGVCETRAEEERRSYRVFMGKLNI
jgi:hypothetical protein